MNFFQMERYVTDKIGEFVSKTNRPSALIVGMGEVGSSLYEVLKPFYEIHTKDLDDKPVPQVDILHVCLRFGPDFQNTVSEYLRKTGATILSVCSTVPPGTTRKIGELNGVDWCHNTTRGLHPNLAKSIRTFTKHIGGPAALVMRNYFRTAGIETALHHTSETTELAHILCNTLYGINLMYHDEMDRLCRKYGVDFQQAVTDYNKTANSGYLDLGHDSKMRMLLTPPGGKIGGHCVVQNAQLIPERDRGPMMDALARYNDPE